MKTYLDLIEDFSDSLILAVNDRLARFLLGAETSKRAFPARRIFSWEAFISQLWNEISLVIPLPQVLSEAAALWRWEKIIQEHSPRLFHIKETAKRAIQAFNWTHEYELSFTEGSTETLNYKAWETIFLAEQAAQQQPFCMSSERLKILSLKLSDPSFFKDFSYLFPQKIFFKGFELFTPVQKNFIEQLKMGGRECIFEAEIEKSLVVHPAYACLSIEDEFRQALSAWGEKVAEDRTLRLAIVIPNLPDYYLFLKRIVKTYLGETPYVISAGLPLNQTPWVKTAFSLLRTETVYFPEATLSLQLKRFLALLKESDWLGDQALSSTTYQMVQGFFVRGEALARESGELGVISAKSALDLLDQALEVPFQEEDPAVAQIFILGMLEAAPIPFDGVWFCGASNEAFPPKPDPNPFIPYELQRTLQLPRSTAEREEALARKLIRRMSSSCREFVVSYPQFTEGVRQELSQVFAEELSLRKATLPSKLLEVLHAYSPKTLEFYEENTLTPVTAEEVKTLKGGVSILANQAACPFKAFALARLKVTPFESEAPYFSAKERGMMIHDVLAKFWAKTDSSKSLHALDENDLQTLLESLIEEALALICRERVDLSVSQRILEKEQILWIVKQWLDFEKTRPPFEVKLLEKEFTTVLAGLPLRLRVDRVDALLPENFVLLVDYKTGRSRLEEWMGDRIESPQLPLYATVMPVDGVAFADVSGRTPSFSGIGRENIFSEEAGLEGIETVSKVKSTSAQTFEDLLVNWKKNLEALAAGMMKGNVRVDPLETACRYCKLELLCRVSASGN